ncbi:MAG: hypothetical protein IT199_00230, partial [Solirubrobacterales bacterium]|nr:hypothetical protein [Solirubrobacterales bacterium]
ETDVSFTVAGYPAPSCTVNGRPSGGRTTETLEPGMNYFVIRCENVFGGATHSATETVPVLRMAAPVVTIGSPENGSVVTAPQVALSFTASGYEQPACTVNGAAATSPADVNLTLGINTVTVRCQNSMGADLKSVSVIRHQVPAVSVATPADGFQTTDSRVDVEFSVSGFPVPDCTVDGEPSSGEATVDLVPGENLIRVLCSNEAGEDSVELTVTRNQAPEVNIEFPLDGHQTTRPEMTVAFSATGFPVPDCEVNGTPASSPASVNLAAGGNPVTVRCQSTSGTDQKSVTVIRHVVPQVSLVSPVDGFQTTDSRVDVEFSVSGFPVPDCTVDGEPSSGQATVDLVPGENLIRVLCSNEAGEDSVEITVVRHRGPEPSPEKPQITHAPETAGIGGVIRFRLDCDTRCRVAPTLSVGSRKRRLQRLWRPAGTHRESYRLRPKTIATLRVRKRNHPRLRIVLKLRPKSHIGFGRAVRIRIGSPYSPDRSPTGSDASHMLVGGQW